MSTYIDDIYCPPGFDRPHSWSDHTRRNLSWHYGDKRADRIMAGTDPNTQADVSAWNRLGERKGDAA